jgi:hypothetical protein
MGQLPNERDFGDYAQWPGRAVHDAAGDQLGEIREIYLDRESGRPEWVLVDVDDDEPRFVPLADAVVEPDFIRIAHLVNVVRSAPSIGPDTHIDTEEERALYDHYGLAYSDGESASGLPEEDEPEASNLAPPAAEPPTPEELESAGIPEPPTARDAEPSEEPPGPDVAAPGVPGPAISDEPETGEGEPIPEVPTPGMPAPEPPPPAEPPEPAPPTEPTEPAPPLPPSPPAAKTTPSPPIAESPPVPPRPEPPRAFPPPPPPPEPGAGTLPVLGTRRRLGLAAGAAGLAALLFIAVRRLRG